MADVGKASKFSVLRIDDDSSDEEGIGGLLANSKKGPGGAGRAGAATGGQQPKKSGPAKKRGKKKPKLVPSWNRLEEDGKSGEEKEWVKEPETDPALERAIQASIADMQDTRQLHPRPTEAGKKDRQQERNSTPHSSSSNNVEEKEKSEESEDAPCPPVSNFLQELEEEAKRIRQAESKKNKSSFGKKTAGEDSVVMKLYVSKLEQASCKISEITMQNQALHEESKKYKERYKKLCQLLKDSEIKEKVQLVVDLERSIDVREELTTQIQDLSAQLEQARSKIHQLEDAHRNCPQGGK